MKRDLKIVITSIVCTLLFIIILLLLVLFGLKNCGGSSKDNTYNELIIDTERNNKIIEAFEEIAPIILENDLYVIFDGIYAELTYSGKHCSIPLYQL